MPISTTCPSCHRALKARDEYAGKQVRCPGCQHPVTIPAASAGLGFDLDDFAAPPPSSTLRTSPTSAARTKAKSSAAASPWYRRQWHWLVVAAVLLLALWPTVGIAFAVIVLVVGIMMALVGGIVPILRILIGAPGTVLTMMVSRSARFEMMRQPDTHPYKVLVRNASQPTRGLLWRGVLLMVAFIPAVYVQSLSAEFFRHRQRMDPAPVPLATAGSPSALATARAPHTNPAAAPAVRPIEPMALAERQQEVPAEQQASEQPFAGPAAPTVPGDTARAPGPAAYRPFDPSRGPRPFPGSPGPGGPGGPAAGATDRVFYVTLHFANFDGSGSPADVLGEVLRQSPGFVSGSIKEDDAARAIQFQHRGRFDLRPYGRQLSELGLRSFRLSQSTRPPPE